MLKAQQGAVLDDSGKGIGAYDWPTQIKTPHGATESIWAPGFNSNLCAPLLGWKEQKKELRAVGTSADIVRSKLDLETRWHAALHFRFKYTGIHLDSTAHQSLVRNRYRK